MQSTCNFTVKCKKLEHANIVKALFEKLVVSFDRTWFDTISEIDKREFSFDVEAENGLGVNVIEYLEAIDYIFKKYDVSDIDFEVEGVEDLDCGSYNAFVISYDAGVLSIKDTHFEVDFDDEDDYFDEDDEDFDETDDFVDNMESYWNAEAEAYKNLEKQKAKTDLTKHSMAGTANPIDVEKLNAIEISF